MFCMFFVKQVLRRHSLDVSQAASQAQLESARKRSEILSNVPFAFDKIGYGQLFTLSCL